MEANYQDIDDNQFSDKFGGYISFADVGNQVSIHYAPVWDFNNTLIHVPYSDPQDKLRVLMNSYLKITNCHNQIKDPLKTYFRHREKNSIFSNQLYQIKHWITSFQSKKIEVVYTQKNITDQICQMDVNNDDYYNPDIHLENKQSKQFQLRIRSTTNTFEPFNVKVRVDSRIGFVKDQIAKFLKNQKNMNVTRRQLRVIAVGATIKDGHKLNEINIHQGSSISILIQNIISATDFTVRVKNKQGNIKLIYDISSGQKIKNIFDYVTQSLNPQDYKLTYRGLTLQLNKRLTDYNIQNKALLILSEITSLKSSEKSNSDDLTFTLRLDYNSEFQLNYDYVKDLTVTQQLCELLPDDYNRRQQKQKYWCLFYGERIVYPFEKFNVLEKFIKKGVTIQVLKNKKFFFYRKLQQNVKFSKNEFPFPIKQKQIQLHKQASSTIKQRIKENIQKDLLRPDHQTVYVTQQFYNPIQCYSCNGYYNRLNAYLRQMNVNQNRNFQDDSYFKLANSLICALKLLPNFSGTVYRGMKNFKFTEKCKKKEGDIICFEGFTSTSRLKQKAEFFTGVKKNTIQNKKVQKTLFIIQSVTGKSIQSFSIYSKEQEVLFLPFSYFHIDYIESTDDEDKIWLTQMPSPHTFKTNLILWVDDIPKNNRKIVQKLEAYNIQIVPVTTTRIANQWMKQFHYLLTFMKVKFRVISDMVRYQNFQGAKKEIPNYQAGIQLIQDFNTKYQFTTRIIIFCGDSKRAIQATQKINNKHIKDKIWSVTASIKAIEEYCMFKQSQIKKIL